MTDDAPPYGPKMLALPNDRWRAFVVALYDEEAPIKGHGLLIWAVQEAGFGNAEGTTSKKNFSNIANRLVQDPRIQAAVAEYSKSVLRAVSPEAIRAIKEIVRGEKHRDRAKVALALADRFDPIEQTATLKIEDTRGPTPEMTEKVLARIDELMRKAGLPAKLAPIIDGEFSVVGDAT